MLGISKINPMVRAIGTMGAVVAVVGGVTFAQLTTNTVTLASNTVSSASASLAIGNTADCSTTTTTNVQGMNFTKLEPGTASSPFTFCLHNTGDVPLQLTALVPGDFTGSQISPADVSLKFSCASLAAPTAQTLTTTVAALNNAPVTFLNSLASKDDYSCTVTATLASTVTGGGTLTPFNLTFTGTDTTPQTATVTGPVTGQPITTPPQEDEPANP